MNELLKKVVVGITTMAMVITMVPVVPAVAETPAQEEDRFDSMRDYVDLGDAGRNVEALQAVLVEEDLLAADSADVVDKVYGAETNVAVVDFKLRYETEIEEILTNKGLQKDADGNGQLEFTSFVGPATMHQVNAIVAQLNYVAEVPIVINPTVAISAETPVARTIPIAATLVDLLKFDITAGTEDMPITEMTFRRIGVGESADFDGLHLFKDGIRLTQFPRALIEETVDFIALEDVVIEAGTTATFTLKVNVDDAPTVGGESAFKLTAIEAGAIEVEGLPIIGKIQRIGAVKVATVELLDGDAITAQIVGSENIEIANFEIKATEAPSLIKEILIGIRGTISRGHVTNLVLYHHGEPIAEAIAVDARDRLVFIIEDGILIDEGRTEAFSVRADIQGRGGDTLKVFIAERADILAIDQNLDFGSIVALGVNQMVGTQILEGGELVIHGDNPAAGDIAIGADDVVIAGVRLLSERDIEIRDIVIEIHEDAGAIENLRIIDAEDGTILVSRTEDLDPGNNTIPGNLFLTGGRERTIHVLVDVREYPYASVGQTIRATTKIGVADTATEVRDLELGALVTDIVNPSITGRTQTIVKVGAQAALLGHPRDTDVVSGEKNVPALGFNISAIGGNLELQEITAEVRVSKSLDATTTGLGDLLSSDKVAGIVSRITLLDEEGEPMADGTVRDGKVVFTGLNHIIPADEIETFTVKIDVVEGLEDKHYVAVVIKRKNIKLVDVDRNDIDLLHPNDYINAPAETERTVITVETVGTLTTALYINTPERAIVTAGEYGVADIPLVIAQLDADGEAMTVERVKVFRTGTPKAEPFTLVELVYNDEVVSSRIFPVDAPYVEFTALDILVPLEDKHNLIAQAHIAGVGFGIASGDEVGLNLEITKATGVHSGLSGIPATTSQGTIIPSAATLTGGTEADPAVPGTATITITNANEPVLASRTLTVRAVPVNLETITIGACTVTFLTTGTEDLDCTGNATIAPIPATEAEVAAKLRALTGVSETGHGTLTIDAGVIGNDVKFDASTAADGNIAFTELAGKITATTTVPGEDAVDDEIVTAIVGGLIARVDEPAGVTWTDANFATHLATAINALPAVGATVVDPANPDIVTITNDGKADITLGVTTEGGTVDVGISPADHIPGDVAEIPAAKAEGTLTLTGTFLVDDVITVTVAGDTTPTTHTITTANLAGETNDDDLTLIATAVAAAINADTAGTTTAPAGDAGAAGVVTAVPATNVVTLTADTAGDAGNAITVTADTAGPGAITATGKLMVVRQTVPTVSTVKGATTVLANGENHIMTVTISADAKDDVTIESLGVHLRLTDGVTVNDFIVREGGIVVADPTAAGIARYNTITFTTPEIIAAGESKTYEIFVDVTGATNDDSIISQLTDDGFGWADGSGVSIPADGDLIDVLPSPSFTISF